MSAQIDNKKRDTPIIQSSNVKEIPPFTLKNVLLDLVNGISFLFFDPQANKIIIPALLFAESILTKIIVKNVGYTEIDYTAYMEQVAQINDGELDYANIYGGTGPLVYPAGHVFIYKILNILTKGTENIRAGQTIFGYLYTFTQCLTFLVFANLELPPWCFYLTCLSKRLHSIYVLRLFNDCFATMYVLLMVLSLQYSISYKGCKFVPTALRNYVAPFFYSASISIKMNALLYFPGFLIALYFLNNENLASMIPSVLILVVFQAVIAYPFLTNGSLVRSSYFANAFDFKRKFMYKWTVNWKFLDSDTFNSDYFHKILFLAHVVLLISILSTKFLSSKQTDRSLAQLIKNGFKINRSTISSKHIVNSSTLVSTKYITLLLVVTNFIGVLCARSLHYQFLAWYSWTYPILLNTVFDNTIYGLVPSTFVFIAHEWCWNVYPSSSLSSSVLFVLNLLVLLGTWARLNLLSVVSEDDQVKKYN